MCCEQRCAIGVFGDVGAASVCVQPRLLHCCTWPRRSFIQAKCTAGLVYELLGNFSDALALSGDDPLAASVIPDVKCMFEFLRAQAVVLHRRPELLMQQVLNTPRQSEIHRLAEGVKGLHLPVAPVCVALRADLPDTPDPCVATMAGHTDWVLSLSLLSASSAVSCGLDGTCRLWNLTTGACTGTLRIGTVSCNVMCTVPRNNSFAIGCGDGSVQVWDVQTQTQLWKVDNLHACSAGDCWETGAGRHGLAFKDSFQGVTACVASQDEQFLFTGGQDGCVRILVAASGCCVGGLVGVHTGVVCAVLPLPGGDIVTVGRDGRLVYLNFSLQAETDSSLVCRSVPGKLYAEADLVQATSTVVLTGDGRSPAGISCGSLSHCGGFVAVGSTDSAVRVFSISSVGFSLVSVVACDAPIMHCRFSRFGSGLVIGTDNSAVVVRMADDFAAAVSSVDLRGHSYAVTGSVELETASIVTSSRDGTLKQWSVADSLPVVDFRHAACVTHALLCPDGRIATTASDRTVKFWRANGDDVATPYVLDHMLPRHDVGVYAVAVDPVLERDRVATCTWGPDKNRLFVWKNSTSSLEYSLTGVHDLRQVACHVIVCCGHLTCVEPLC
jgi:WD40 repeat protein